MSTQLSALCMGAGMALASWTTSWLILAGGAYAKLAQLNPGVVYSDGRSGLDFALERSSHGVTPADSWWWLTIAGAHSATPFDLFHTAGCAVAAIAICMLIGGFVETPSGRLARPLVRVLATPGRMPLSLYTTHIVLTAAVAAHVANADASTAPLGEWQELGLNVLVLMFLGLAWSRFVSVRGPLEWVLAQATRPVLRAFARDKG